MPTLTIRLTDKQAEQIKQAAEDYGMTKGSVIKSRIFGKAYSPRRVPRPDQIELARIVGQLGKLGGNINQIAHSINAGKIPPNAELIAGLKAAREGLENIGADVRHVLRIRE